MSSSTFVHCLSSNTEIHREFINAIEKVSKLDRHWASVLGVAYVNDIDDMALRVVAASISERDECKMVMAMDDGDPFQWMLKVIQALSDTGCQTRRRLSYFLEKIVRKRERGVVFPEFLNWGEINNMGSMMDQISGGHARIKKLECNDGKTLALKVLNGFSNIEDPDEAVMKEFVREMMIWRQFNHVNILPFMGYANSKPAIKFAFVSPWMKNGSLTEYLKNNVTIAGRERLAMITGIASGLHYLHHELKPLVVHADLTGGNVVLDENRTPRIADFGYSKVLDSKAFSDLFSSSFKPTTLNYRAPELWVGNTGRSSKGIVTNKCDLYSFAGICYQIFTLEVPFNGLTGQMVYEAINDSKDPLKTPRDVKGQAYQRGLTDGLRSLLKQFSDKDPQKRPDLCNFEVKKTLNFRGRSPVQPRPLPDLRVFNQALIDKHKEFREQVVMNPSNTS
ncbi:kinase-like protein [Rickenella mellea]|uniref:Kinase-like protein n=1 Tax=Rickenella mellea TaxID=50990 RepID=A0A4Y7PT13_9AGAM|nr:kinase-like protein [Rickenella mellea]